MPIFVIALLALLAFGFIGVLLLIAMFIETRRETRREDFHSSAPPGGKRAA